MSLDMGHQIELSTHSGFLLLLQLCWISSGCYSGLSCYSRNKPNPCWARLPGVKSFSTPLTNLIHCCRISLLALSKVSSASICKCSNRALSRIPTTRSVCLSSRQFTTVGHPVYFCYKLFNGFVR